jgi:hypothetical protein
MFKVAALIVLVTVHQIDGRAVLVNPRQVTSMAEARDSGQIPDAVNCVIALTDGRFLSVAETCTEVRALLEGEPP